MEFIKGYFYTTLQAAQSAVIVINEGEGLPKEGGSTLSYCQPAECVGGWFILADAVTSKYLTGAVDVELINEDEMQ